MKLLGVGLVVMGVLVGCASDGERLKLYKFAPQAAPAELRDGELVVRVQRAQSAVGATNYILHVLVANNGAEPLEFKTTSLDLTDADGVSHPPIVPNVGLVATAGVLVDQTIAPQHKIKGSLYFQTAPGDARSPRLTVKLGPSKLELDNAGFMSDDDLKVNDPFKG